MELVLRRRLLHFSQRLYLYPPPEPLPRTPSFWVALSSVVLAAFAFSLFFSIYLIGRHNAYLTTAEDLGIMDQALWNTVHGSLLHQTICNPIGDTNCSSLGGISRFALHFEPILLLIALFYLVLPSPTTLLVLQTLVVASGAFPAFWLARLRLRNEWAGVVLALLYLLYPAQQQATIFDFHAVTLTAAFLLFALYFLYTRRTLWLFIFAVLAMACKEEIPLLIAGFGLWSLLFQRRWRSSIALIVLALAWTGMALLVIHLSSPTGHSLLTPRYTYLGHGPLQIMRTVFLHPRQTLNNYVLEPDHLHYLRVLLSPLGYLPLLAPWIFVLAVPTLGLNLLSSDPLMYTGLFQYNAEIVPILIFATIESLRLLTHLASRFMQSLSSIGQTGRRTQEQIYQARPQHAAVLVFGRRPWHMVQRGLLVVWLSFLVLSMLRADRTYGSMPFSQGFQWSRTTPHVKLAQSFLDRIPPSASISVQTTLTPHLSHRANVYQFPYADMIADYVLLDVTSNMYPFYSTTDYVREAKKVLLSGSYGIVEAHDGYVLLKRGVSPPGISSRSFVRPGALPDSTFVLPNLPLAFCSYINGSRHMLPNPVQVAFQNKRNPTSTMDLIGFHVKAPSTLSIHKEYISVTTYWRVLAPPAMPLQLVMLITDRSGKEYLASTDVPALLWCPTYTWKPGMIVRLSSQLFSLRGSSVPLGPAHLSLALAWQLQSTQEMMNVQTRLPLHVITTAGRAKVRREANALQVKSLTLTP